MAITLLDVAHVLCSELEEPERSEIAALIAARAQKRIPNFQEGLTWMETTPILARNGRALHWSLYCVSGMNMPPHPGVPDILPQPASKIVYRMFEWMALYSMSGTTGPYTRADVELARSC